MSSLLFSETEIGLKHFFYHNVRYVNFTTFKIGVALESWQYLDNHEPQRFDFCIDCKSTDRTCQLSYHQVKLMIIYEGANILVSGAFLKCFSINTMKMQYVISINAIFKLINSLHAEYFFMFFVVCCFFPKINVLKKFFQEYHPNVKQFRP